MKITYSKETRETAENLRIIDDAFFRLLAEKEDVCQEILQTLLEDPELRVLKSEAQVTETSLHREITMDALCITQKNRLCNVEMQKGNCYDDVARTRFHASLVTANHTPKGTDFSDVPDVTIVYITEYDALNNKRTVTHVSRCMETDTGKYVPVNDGEDIVYANTCIVDDSDKSRLLQLMLRKDSFYDERFPAVSNAVKYYKESKGGQEEMCEAIEKLANSRAEKVRIETRIETRNETRIEMIRDFLDSGASAEDAVQIFNASSEELDKAKALMLQTV